MKNLPLALLLLPTATTAQTLVRVCGSTYSDASFNCTVNPSCATGDGCPEDKDTCFALPEESCLSSPTAAPTLQVCGMDYEDAQSSCDRLCEEGCGAMEACFNVIPEDCVEDSVTDLAMVASTVEAVAFLESSEDVTVCGLSFVDAAANCETNTPCSPTGNECGIGEACFVVPFVNCTANVTASTDVLMNSTAPSLSTAGTTAPAPTAPPVEPTHVFVCGVDYGDAEQGCSTNIGCPSGDGCSGGETCFAVPYANCRDAPATTVAAMTTGVSSDGSSVVATEAVGGNVSDTQVGSTVVAIGSTEAANVTADATTASGTTPAAGEPNLFFCGESYELAETMCSTNLPCPGGGGCPQGQACFGIPSECKSPEPTLSPSVIPSEAVTNLTIVNETSPSDNVSDAPALRTTEPSLAPVSSAPTEAPIVNTHFCGANYTDAFDSCDFDRACPGGFECPGGQTCFTGITCEATASTGSTISAQTTPAASPGASISPTLRGTSTGSVGASFNASSQETVNLDNLLVFRYCGFSPDDARDNCATATSCLDGTDAECPSGQACFELEEACSAVPGGATGGDTSFPAFTPVTTLTPTVPVTDKPVFDPNITSFCGVDYDDAQANCFYATPCPGNANAECDAGQTCFPGITTCEIPETPPPTSAPESGGGNETDINGTLALVVPTVSPTPKPQYDLSGFGESGSGGDGSGSVTQKCSVGVLISGLVAAVAALL